MDRGRVLAWNVDDVPAGLDAICRKALAPSTNDRYSNALQLASDLENWMADEPVEAMEENWLQKASRWTRKNRMKTQWIVTAVLLALVSLAIGVTSSVVKDQELVQQRVAFLETQGNFNDILIRTAFEDLRKDVQLQAGRPTVTQAAVAFSSGDEDPVKLAQEIARKADAELVDGPPVAGEDTRAEVSKEILELLAPSALPGPDEQHRRGSRRLAIWKARWPGISDLEGQMAGY